MRINFTDKFKNDITKEVARTSEAGNVKLKLDLTYQQLLNNALFLSIDIKI